VHLIVTRFAVPREDAATAGVHRDPRWLDVRLALFRRFFVPSVGRLGVPVVLLCGPAAAEYVGGRVADLPWARVAVHGGNLSNRRPAWWRLGRRVAKARLAEFGIQEPAEC
jgi:hypothetical protein